MAWPSSSAYLPPVFLAFLRIALPFPGLVYLLAFTWKIFPLSGGYALGSMPSLSLSFFKDALYHSILPALSIVLASLGSWAIGMRGMMISGLGEDYITFAEAKGLKGREIFLRYAMRNALLPQVTALALSLGYIVSGAVLVASTSAHSRSASANRCC